MNQAVSEKADKTLRFTMIESRMMISAERFAQLSGVKFSASHRFGRRGLAGLKVMIALFRNILFC
jgi:hypothetical protein